VSGEGPSNAELAAALHEYAALLELGGAEPYAARAFRRAAELVASTPLDVAGLVRSGRARELRGIGPGIEARLAERVATGRIAEVEELRREGSPELAALGLLLGFGARTGASIGAALEIRTAAELRAAAAAGRLREVRGVGAATEAAIKTALERERPEPERSIGLDRALELTGKLAAALGGVPAGDARRWKDAPTRLAVVVATARPDEVRVAFAEHPAVVVMLEPDVGVTADGLPVELHVTAPAGLGAALVRATGSAAYVASLGPLPDAASEEDVYRRVGLPFVPPELRELPAAPAPADLVEVRDIRGDLHCHTTSSDGRASVLEMAEAARARGYEYLAICDHTKAVGVVPGLDADGLRRQAEEIAAANDRLAPFRVLRGVECDIVADGELDLPDDVLAELDWVQLSLHAGQRAPRRELTARVTHAMQHPAVRCLSHPTGRLIGRRPENALDLERTFETAVAKGVALEVNGLPARLDLSGEHVRAALAAGVDVVCSTDAHSAAGLGNMPLAVHTARRGGAPAPRVLNTLPLGALLGARARSPSGG
jgi:DNA polymerase (family 10)